MIKRRSLKATCLRKKLKSSLEILSRLELSLDKCILVLNKIDKVKSNEIKDKSNDLVITRGMSQVVSISAELGYNIPRPVSKIFFFENTNYFLGLKHLAKFFWCVIVSSKKEIS